MRQPRSWVVQQHALAVSDRLAAVSDATLKDLERRWTETGTVEDEAAWLRARVQAGQLERERLRLAAYCRHSASQAALGAEEANATGECAEIQELIRWSRPIAEFGRSAWASAILPLAEDDAVLWEHSRHRPTANLGAPALAVDAA